ncbi:MAG: DoxX family protein [Saprospiraceae bacterium]
MSTLQLISLIVMASFYIFAGISHFRVPKIFLKITPKWVPYPEKVNILVGIIELILGVSLFFESTRSFAAMGIIALLIAVFPANIYHFQQARKKGKLVIPTLIRLPIQLILIWWAYSFV